MEIRRISSTQDSRLLYYLIREITQKSLSASTWLLKQQKTLVCSFVLSKLDCCNSLLSGCPPYLLSRLQKVQNSAANLVFKARKHDHLQPLLQALHWLSAQARIDYKLSTIGHNVFSDLYPAYFSDLTVYTPS